MREVKLKIWLRALAVTVGVTCSAFAQDGPFLTHEDIVGLDDSSAPVFKIIDRVLGSSALKDSGTAGSCGLSGRGDWLWFDSGERWELGKTLFEDDSGWDIGGWTQWGFTNRSDGMFNDRPGKFNNHQSWLFAEKIPDGTNGPDFGGRVDLIYGIDAVNTQAFGNRPGHYDFENGWNRGDYGWALPQLYAEMAYGDWKVKAGHFYTLLGYEVVAAPGNFFYSHAYTMFNNEAFTHTGILSTYSPTEHVKFHGGWTLGWNTGFDQFNGGSNFLGGVSIKLTDDLTWTYVLTAGNFGYNGQGYSHSIVNAWKITDRLEYVFQNDLLTIKPIGATGRYDTVSVNQYLFYTVSKRVKYGGRMEWWKADGVSYYEATVGVNYKPNPNLTLRPEVRYQWAPAVNHDPARQIVPVDQGTIFGIDAILTF